jgi:hypothetical protein
VNPVIGLILIGAITLGLIVAPNLVFAGGWGLIVLALAGITTLFVVFWWKVIASWIRENFSRN